jgi:pyruvate formate-lyase activating enzyme-like uncharacterized protein
MYRSYDSSFFHGLLPGAPIHEGCVATENNVKKEDLKYHDVTNKTKRMSRTDTRFKRVAMRPADDVMSQGL